MLCIYPWDSQVCHQLFEGPRLLCLLLVVQRDLLAELPGVWATCARGAGHRAGRSIHNFSDLEKVEDGAGGGGGGGGGGGLYFSKSPSERCREPVSVSKTTAHIIGLAEVSSREVQLRA